MKTAKQKSFAKPIINYLIKRIGEDEGLAEDVLKKQKSWEQCFKYIYEKARKEAVRNVAAIVEDTVYEWAEDYYRGTDKDIEKVAGKAGKKASVKVKAAQPKDSKFDMNKAIEKATATSEEAAGNADETEPEILAKPKAQKKPKKQAAADPGQMSIFDYLGGLSG